MSPQTVFHNGLLRAMPPATIARLRGSLTPVTLNRGDNVDHVDGRIESLYFVERGFVSIIKTMEDGRSVEVGGVGVEGLTDPTSVFGVDTAALESMVQIPGEAFRIKRDLLMREMAGDEALARLIQNYVRFAFSQLAQTAACNRLHSLEERCCRWLLIGQDNARAASFPLTHEFLAMMLGVQRSGVSIAARLLKNAGLIDYTRGQVTILDREGLEDAACECYASFRHDLGLLFPQGSRSPPP